MKDRNICKFIRESAGDRLIVRHFVRETELAVAASPHVLSCHTVYLSGKEGGWLCLGGRRERMERGSLLFGFRGETCSFEGSASPDFLYIGFEGGRAEELFARYGISAARRRFSGHEALLPFWQNALSLGDAETLDLLSESVLLYTFSRLSQKRSEEDDVMRRVLRLLEEEFSDGELSLSRVAGEMGYHEKYLSHRFHLYTGVTFSRYLRDLRIKNAVFLLDHGVLTVKNVALLCGFRDPLYFSKVFKETVGISPTEYLAAPRERPLQVP